MLRVDYAACSVAARKRNDIPAQGSSVSVWLLYSPHQYHSPLSEEAVDVERRTKTASLRSGGLHRPSARWGGSATVLRSRLWCRRRHRENRSEAGFEGWQSGRVSNLQPCQLREIWTGVTMYRSVPAAFQTLGWPRH